MRGLPITLREAAVTQPLYVSGSVEAVAVAVSLGWWQRSASLALPEPFGGKRKLPCGLRDAVDSRLRLHPPRIGGMEEL